MSFNKVVVIAAVVSAGFLSSCTREKRGIEVVSPKQPATQPIVGNPGNGTIGAGAEVPVVLQEKELKPYVDNTANLTYKFTFLAVALQDKIAFDAAGTAKIVAKGLPAGQPGSVVLEIYEGAVLKLRGAVDNVTLAAGSNNNLNLKLAKVDGSVNPNPGGTGGTVTDLTIDVTLDNGTGGNGNPGSNGNGNGGTNPGTNPGINPGGNGGNTDPLADWDGKSFRGNARWNIVPVNG